MEIKPMTVENIEAATKAIMEIKPMTVEKIEAATKALAVKAGTADANDALKYSQAALNLAHVLATLNYMK